jgi:chitosanase
VQEEVEDNLAAKPNQSQQALNKASQNLGGGEKTWIKQYVDVRHKWLPTHPNKLLRGTLYRTRCFKREISRKNWGRSQLPINANGVKVSGQEPSV